MFYTFIFTLELGEIYLESIPFNVVTLSSAQLFEIKLFEKTYFHLLATSHLYH